MLRPGFTTGLPATRLHAASTERGSLTEVDIVANAKKKASAKKKAAPRPAVKKASPSKASKKAAPAKVPPKKASAAKPAAKPAPKKAASKAKPVAKKAAAKKPAAKPASKPAPVAKPAVPAAKPAAAKTAKPVASKPATTNKHVAPAKVAEVNKPAAVVASKLPARKPEPPKAAPVAPTPAPTAVQTTSAKADKKDSSARKKADTPPRQVARASTAVAKVPSHDHSNPAPRTRMINLDEVKLPAGYVPKADEEYMNPMQLLYFRNKLQAWREELITESQETLDHLRSEIRDVGDEAERASRESDNILELRTRDRYRKLLKKIDDAIKRIEDGSYGYCEETGEEIGLGRLEARPIATLTVDAQERRELFQKQFRDER
ncbi:MAG: RNA polymerase-binding protein DksA [Gammaproteobacteria bacterium]